MPQTPRPQPLTSACSFCGADGFTDALDLHAHTTSVHFRLTSPVRMEMEDEDLVVVE